MDAPARITPPGAAVELTVDELARRAGLPTRTIREYQTMGLLPSPERRGRVGIYRVAHLHRLQLIGRLQDRGYSLAGIRDLLTSWTDGDELTDILGLSPDDLLAVGVIDHCGPDRYCVPSPSLLQLTVDALATGYTPTAVLSLLTAVHDAAELVAGAAHTLV